MDEKEALQLASKMAGVSISNGEGASGEGATNNGGGGKKQGATLMDGEHVNVESPDVD